MKPFLFKTFRGYGSSRTRLLTQDPIMKNSELNQATLLTLSQHGGADGKAHKPKRRWLATGLGALMLGLGFAGAASAQDVYLRAQPYTKTITIPNADPVDVDMWGFADCGTDDTFTTCTLDTNAAGPQINVDIGDGDPDLTIHLSNTLPVPVSIVMPGQFGGGDPNKPLDLSGRPRMTSMTHEASANGGTADYQWTNMKTGTYLYHSGSYPSIQVPMGLYGAVTVVNGTVAYAGVTPADTETVILLSEVDPVQNARVVASGLTAPTEQCVPMADYKVNATAGYPCTIDYNPIYFLVNGTNAPATQVTDGTAEQTVLIRFLNAGLRTHTPAFAGVELSLIAEDGNLYPGMPRKQASALLTAGKTMDALVTAPSFADQNGVVAGGVTWSLYDHMSSFTNVAGDTNGGALTSLNVANGTPPVTATIYAVDDTYTDVIEDTPYAGASVLSNDVGMISPTAAVVTCRAWACVSPPPGRG